MLQPARILMLIAVALPAARAAETRLVHGFEKLRLSDQFHGEGATFADIDGDGKIDIVSGPYWYSGPRFATRHDIYPGKPFDPKGYSDNFFAFAHDFDADRRTDILVLGFPGKDAAWYRNPKDPGGAWTRHQVFDVVDNESPTFADLDGDQRPELLFHTGGRLGWAGVDWKDPAKPWTFHAISPPGGWQKFTHGYGVGDVNGDGRADLLEQAAWWEQPASLAGDPLWVRHAADFGGGGAQMLVYDVDGDGRNDVITSLSAHGWGLAWFKQGGDRAQPTFSRQLIMGDKPEDNRFGVRFSQMHALALIDMDGDGLQDIVTGKRYWAHGPGGDPEPAAPAVLYWFRLVRGPGGAVEHVPYLIDDDSGVGTQVVAGDVNGDGLPDVVVGNKKGTFVLLHTVKKASKSEWEQAQPKALR